MEADRKLIARKLFRLRVHEAKGVEYQHLFEKVMQYRYPDFIPIKPYGNIGDRKNDGYIPITGTYFQVYAPENPESSRSETKAAAKVAEDFEGLRANWSPIKAFHFVFNDSYRGSPPPVEDALATIRADHKIEASVFLAKDLEREALDLEEDQLSDVINTPIPEVGPLPNVDFQCLREVINHVLRTKPLASPTSGLQAPDFDEKIEFNGLTRQVGSLLTAASYQNEAVVDYFSKNSTFARQQVRDQLAGMYIESKVRLNGVADSLGAGAGDLVFFDLLQRIIPESDGTASHAQRVAAQEAAIVVMAFYFEACDIFEDPNAVA